MLPLRQLAAALANVQLTSAHGPWSLEVYDPHGNLAQRIAP